VAFDDDDARRTPCAANNTALDRPVSAADHYRHLGLVSSYIRVSFFPVVAHTLYSR
jgi:hypothetical protein